MISKFTYAAVAPNTSACFALVNSPTLAANRVVNRASKPSFKSFDFVLYSIMMAPTSNKAANMALKYEMKIDIFLPDAYPTRGPVEAPWVFSS